MLAKQYLAGNDHISLVPADALEDDDFPAFPFGGRWSPSLEGIQVETKSCDLTTQFGNERRAPGCLLDIFRG